MGYIAFKNIRLLPVKLSLTVAVIDCIFLLALHGIETACKDDDGVISYSCWDIARAMRWFWFQAHKPWSEYLQRFYSQIWLSHQPAALLQYEYEILCLVQTLLVGFMIGLGVEQLLRMFRRYFGKK